MASITTITTLLGTDGSFATKQMKSLVGQFDKIQAEKLRSRSELPKLFNQESVPSLRVFVRTYSFSHDKSDQPTR